MSKAVIQATPQNVTRLLNKAGYIKCVGNSEGFLVQKLNHLGKPDAVYITHYIPITGFDIDKVRRQRGDREKTVMQYKKVLALRYKVRQLKNKVGNGYLVVTPKKECGTTEGTR